MTKKKKKNLFLFLQADLCVKPYNCLKDVGKHVIRIKELREFDIYS